MNVGFVFWELVCCAGFALSLKSILVLGARSPFTIAGWIFTAAYFALAAYDALMQAHPAFRSDYACVALLAVAFVVAGIRKEPQAVPWWWPNAEDAADRTP